jgi:hypothetical protein
MTDQFDSPRVVGTPYRSSVYHTQHCRHIQRARTHGYEINEPSESAMEYHDLDHCESCSGEHAAKIHDGGPVPDV